MGRAREKKSQGCEGSLNRVPARNESKRIEGEKNAQKKGTVERNLLS